MDIFVRGLPNNATTKQVETFFAAPFAEFSITAYHCEKHRNKNTANITVLNVRAACQFLDVYGVPANAPAYIQPRKGLSWASRSVKCTKSRIEPSQFSIRSLHYATSQRAHRAANSTESQKQKPSVKITRFAISSLQCGHWDYVDNVLTFTTQFRDSRQGTISFGLKQAVIVLSGENSSQRRIHINYYDCSNIVLGHYGDPVINFTLRMAPKFYDVAGEDAMVHALMSVLSLGPTMPRKLEKEKKTRVTGIDDDHAQVAGMCHVYRLTLSNYTMISHVRSLLSGNFRAPSHLVLPTSVTLPAEHITQSLVRLNFELTDQEHYGMKPFPMLYQLDRLARNGILLPRKVIEMLPKIAEIHETYGLDATLSALRRLSQQVPAAGPDVEASELSNAVIKDLLQELAESYDHYRHSPENPYELNKRHTHINLIHKIIVTPCGVYLSGPEAEPTNRVLRRHDKHIQNFARVVFQDEDGGAVRYDPLASNHVIFHQRFKGILDKGILIAGKMFSFLGFSHSSLRSQSCWFMAPIFADGTLKLPHHVLKELGNFSNIRVPAKCAARIGQNFTDTNATVDLEEAHVGELAMVQRGAYDFSDGVGTISHDLLERIWMVYGRRRLLKPTAIQIRYKGYKGMVSLDSRLSGQRLMLRDNMKKFDASADVCNLEICGAGFKPLPMVLNRQFIKIFEDLGVDASVFMDLQKAAVDKLRFQTANATNTASFLDEMDCSRSTRVPSLIQYLAQIGLDWRQDEFLYRVVEIAIVTKLRDIKYRGRIPVEDGVTLYGIMDETGELAEGEIFVIEESSPEGGKRVRVQENVVVTRSPALHPGDVQIVNAVDVLADSPLRKLMNVVVFSQHGDRDLPSMLSGGDLDGDLYNVIFDRRLIPQRAVPAAEYPKVSAGALDREVTSTDMSDFFVKFMESDLLGVISNIHLQLADQCELGTSDPSCIKLAAMASTAVDFSKTGIPVDMSDCPRHDRCRPDFMAPSPRVIVAEQGHLGLDEPDDQDEDDAFVGLDAEKRAIRYYESPKVLGRLFRAIDERQFLAKMQEDLTRDIRQIANGSGPSASLPEILLAYMKRQAAEYMILFEHHRDLARDIRTGYEASLLDLLHHYEPSPHQPVSETEAFAGTILGRKAGAQGKPLRELSQTLRERFESVLEYNIMRIVKGDKQMHGVSDLDLLYDDDGALDREVEALPRAIACLEVAVMEKGWVDRELGELVSFRYVAAGVCLRELERFRIVSLGSSVLPFCTGGL